MFSRRQRAIVLKNVDRVCELNAVLSGISGVLFGRPIRLQMTPDKLIRI